MQRDAHSLDCAVGQRAPRKESGDVHCCRASLAHMREDEEEVCHGVGLVCPPGAGGLGSASSASSWPGLPETPGLRLAGTAAGARQASPDSGKKEGQEAWGTQLAPEVRRPRRSGWCRPRRGGQSTVASIVAGRGFVVYWRVQVRFRPTHPARAYRCRAASSVCP